LFALKVRSTQLLMSLEPFRLRLKPARASAKVDGKP